MIKVAIVDDDINLLQIMETYLSRSGDFTIDTYIEPQNAQNNILTGKYDIVLLDIEMPNINGIELLTKIKQLNPNQKVIMITATSTQDRLIECEKLGTNDYITKPFISLRDVQNKILDRLSI